MRSISKLKQDVRLWDGKSAVLMVRVYEQYCDTPDFAFCLTQLMCEQEFQRGASWLLKHHIDTGHIIHPKEAQNCFASLDKLTHWDTRLHILQSMHAMPIAADHRQAVYDFLDQNITSKRTLVRAWTYTGYVVLAQQHEEYRPQVMALLNKANEIETAGSIKVRIRKGLTQLGA